MINRINRIGKLGLIKINKIKNKQHPNLISRYSARGKTNSDADRDILKDLSGNGRDIVLNNFGFTINSGYENPLYTDGLVFDGVDDYGVSTGQPALLDYTIICKREGAGPGTTIASIVASKGERNAFIFEGTMTVEGQTTQYLTMSYDGGGFLPEFEKGKVSWQTKDLYNGAPIENISEIQDGTNLWIGGEPTIGYGKLILYDFLLYDRTLTLEEIQTEINKYKL